MQVHDWRASVTLDQRNAITAQAVVALAGGLVSWELEPVIRYLARDSAVELTPAELGRIRASAILQLRKVGR